MNDDDCCSCGKKMDYLSVWACEECGGEHHEKCSGENYEGYGEYPDESAYSVCQKCIDKQDANSQKSE